MAANVITTAVKIGDNVRCTLGETVVVGIVVSVYGKLVGVAPELDEHGGCCWITQSWHIEALPPPNPPISEIEGAVVIDRDGDAWQFLGGIWRAPELDSINLKDLQQVFGPLIVVYVPDV